MEESEVLQEFIGRKVRVEEKEMTFTSSRYGERKYTHCAVADDDEVMHELNIEAAKLGLNIRTWTPNSIGTCDFRTDRVNVRLDKSEDGTYSITKVYLG